MGPIRKYGLFGAQYFLQGAFYGLLVVLVIKNWLPKEWATQPGQLGLLASAMMWPWALKFCLGPVADALRQHQRKVLLACNGGMALVAILLSLVSIGDFSTLLILAVAASVLRCLQDVTTDGLAIANLRKEDIATANAVMWLAQTGGFWAGGAGMLTLKAACGADYNILMLIVAAIVAAVAIIGFTLGSSVKQQTATSSQKEADKTPPMGWKQLMVAFMFALLAPVGASAFSSAFVGPWLKMVRFEGGTLALLETANSLGGIAGVLIAGFAGKRLASKTFILVAGLAAAIPYIGLGLLAPIWHHHGLMAVLIGIISAGEKMWIVALAAVFMSILSGREKTAALYAAFASALNAAGSLGPLAGAWAAGRCGYPALFILAGGLLLPSLVVSRLLKMPNQPAKK